MPAHSIVLRALPPLANRLVNICRAVACLSHLTVTFCLSHHTLVWQVVNPVSNCLAKICRYCCCSYPKVKLLSCHTLSIWQVVNLVSNRLVKIVGKVENTERFLQIALYQVRFFGVRVLRLECLCWKTIAGEHRALPADSPLPG